MTTSDYIATASLIIAFTASIYTYFTNTKKYELTSQYRTEIISWYSETIDILIRLKIEAKDSFKDENLRRELLAKLSTKIEIGRFYFPNINKGDNFGVTKPKAYKGYRNLILDYLVFSFNVFEKQDAKLYLKHAETLQRLFSSHLYEILDPKSFLKEIEKHTSKTFSKDLTFEDFIQKDPDAFAHYL